MRAPVAQEDAVGGFNAAGKPRSVHDDGRFEAIAQGSAQVLEPRQVARQLSRSLHILVLGKSGQFRKAEVSELTQARARDGAITDKADDRNAHPKRVEAGGVAVVGIRVEDDIELVIQRQIILPWACGDKFHSFWGNTVTAEDLESIATVAAESCQQKEAGGGNSLKHAGPQGEERFVDFKKVIQATKSDGVILQSG